MRCNGLLNWGLMLKCNNSSLLWVGLQAAPPHPLLQAHDSPTTTRFWEDLTRGCWLLPA